MEKQLLNFELDPVRPDNRIVFSAYTLSKVHVGLHQGGNSCSCPSCASPRTVSNGVRITASGLKKRRLQCLNCGKYFSISSAEYDKLNKV